MHSPEHEVEVAISGVEALDKLEQGLSFDVILCDLMMPIMSGIDLHRRLEQEGSGYVKRMIFMTGGVFTSTEQKFLRGLERPWLAKPIDIDELKLQIARCIAQR